MLPFPFSIQVITTQPVVNSPVLPNDLTNINNQVQSSRAINPLTQDYELNSNGTFTGQSFVQMSVYLALFTTLNSSAVAGLGNNIKSLTIIGNNIVNQVTSIINQALASLINQGTVSLVSCQVTDLGNGNLNVQVNWRDLTINSTGQPIQTTNIVIGTN